MLKNVAPKASSLLLVLLLSAVAARAENSQVEVSASWFLDPVSQNWSCSVAAGKASPSVCRGYAAQDNAFVQAEPVVVSKQGLGTRYYFYVGTWGQLKGPTSECIGDGIGIFQAPYSAAGARGSNLVYKGSAKPCDGSYWNMSSAFYDAERRAVYVTGERWSGNPTDPAFKHIHLLTSPDIGSHQDGLNFTDQRIVSSGMSSLLLLGLEVRPHPTQANVWWGFLKYDDATDPWWHASTKAYVDWDSRTPTIHYLSGPSSWTSIPFGGQITVAPYPVFSTMVDSFTFVRGRWEVWVAGDDVSELTPRSGYYPCSPTPPLYFQNVEGPFSCPGAPTCARWGTGSWGRYYVVDENFNVTQGPKAYWSQVRAIPADYTGEVQIIHRSDTLAGRSFYAGSQRRTICSVDLHDYPFFWSGSGIFVTQLQDQ